GRTSSCALRPSRDYGCAILHRIDPCPRPCYSTGMKKGVPVSPGVAVARAYCMDQTLARREPSRLDLAAVSSEISRLDAACAAATQELDSIIARVSNQVGGDEAAIFRAHRQLLRDPALIGKVKSSILNRHVDARTALHETLEEYNTLFERIPDEYLKERMADVRDVVGRVISQLALHETKHVLDV